MRAAVTNRLCKTANEVDACDRDRDSRLATCTSKLGCFDESERRRALQQLFARRGAPEGKGAGTAHAIA